MPLGSVPSGALATTRCLGRLCAAPVRLSPAAAAPCVLRPVARAAAAPASQPRSGASALASLAGAGPPLLAPRSHARPLVRRCAAPRALAAAVCLRARPRVAAGSLFGRPCCARAWPLCSASARGGPLRARGRGFALRARSSLPRPAAAPLRLWARGLLAGPPGGLRPPFSPPGAPRVGCAPAPARACGGSVRLRSCGPRCLGLRAAVRRTVAAPRRARFSPAPLPSPPPPPGLRGGVRPVGWASPPAAWVALLAPLLRLPLALRAVPGAVIRPRLTVRKLSTGDHTDRVRADFGA